MKDCKSISWKLFEKTGSPAAYLLFSALGKDELSNDDDGRET